jgi:hypothetical protein
MLDTDTKRRIDTARDILVGKVPDTMASAPQAGSEIAFPDPLFVPLESTLAGRTGSMLLRPWTRALLRKLPQRVSTPSERPNRATRREPPA